MTREQKITLGYTKLILQRLGIHPVRIRDAEQIGETIVQEMSIEEALKAYEQY